MGAWYNKGIPQNTFLVTTHRYSLFSPFSGLQKPPLHFVLCHDNPENVVQITPQKRPAGTNIKSNFYFVLIGYFREISDIKGDKSAGEHPIPIESGFDGKKWETEPVSGLFLSREQEKRGDRGRGDQGRGSIPHERVFPPSICVRLYFTLT